MPDGSVGGAAARGDDGLPPHRPSRHRGLHRREARPGEVPQLQPVGAGHRRVHDGARKRTPTGRWFSAGETVRTVRARELWDAADARDLRCRRARRDLRRPGQQPEQSRALRDHQREQSLRRADASALWRVPARLDQSRAAGRQSVRGRRRSTRSSWPTSRAPPCGCSTMSSTFRATRLPSRRLRPRPSAGSASASPAWPTRCCSAAPPTAASEAVALTRQWLGIVKREAYRASAELAAEKGAFPLYDPIMLDRPNLANLDEETRALIARAWPAQRLPYVDRADRHDVAPRRQCLLGYRAGVRLQLHPQDPAARRDQARGAGRGLCDARLAAGEGRCAASRRICSSARRPSRRPIILRCRRPPRLWSTARSPRP